MWSFSKRVLKKMLKCVHVEKVCVCLYIQVDLEVN